MNLSSSLTCHNSRLNGCLNTAPLAITSKGPMRFSRSAPQCLHSQWVVLALLQAGAFISKGQEDGNFNLGVKGEYPAKISIRYPKKKCNKTKLSCSYHQAGPCIEVTDGIVMRAATVMVITAGGTVKWAASPCQTIVCIFINTAAGVALRTGEIAVTDGWWLYWRWWRWTRVGGIFSFLDRVRGQHCNTTFATRCANQIAHHLDIACLSPVCTP